MAAQKNLAALAASNAEFEENITGAPAPEPYTKVVCWEVYGVNGSSAWGMGRYPSQNGANIAVAAALGGGILGFQTLEVREGVMPFWGTEAEAVAAGFVVCALCEWCGGVATPAHPVTEVCVSPPVDGYPVEMGLYHSACAAKAAAQMVM